jgi:predicted helicase
MFDRYISAVDRLYRSGNATEHSYRPALQDCLTEFLKDVQVTNEPRRQECGAPDYILTRKEIPVGFIEAKNLGKSLDLVERGGKDDDQWRRYTQSLDNIILTDYLEFRFFRNGEKTDTVKIGEIRNGKVIPLPDDFARLETMFRSFAEFPGETIKSARRLAEMMAHKAALMRDVFYKVVKSDEPSTLKDQLAAFKEVLMHDMDEAQFADVYAQTVAYGLFTAKLHDESKNGFSRGEALTLIPKTNPFLQKLFLYVAGADIDKRIVWIVDTLCEVYRAADMKAILKNFGVETGRRDPILHFYETFLAEYDPKLREVRGVYYTPEPVVQFIVRAIDDVLKDHFGLKDGLADTSKIEIDVPGHARGKTVKVREEVHKVQLLDVATGTGTFLAEIVKQVYAKFKGQEGLWGSYVEKDLLPRMHGFELLVASYAMCHMKLDLLLKGYGYDSSKSSRRLSVYLTNSLEEQHKDSHLPFANWLSTEANEASRIKRDMPIMIALGNPPYSGVSSNMGSWIAQQKIEDYKYVDGVHFNERKHWLNDDYVQFIRLGEHYIERNGEGILAYITNHGYLDNPTFRGMRWHLMNTFDSIYVLDLHGNSKKKETAPDGSADKNVFDIQQGVAILVAIKTKSASKEKPLAQVYHAEIWGSREHKYKVLSDSSLQTMDFKKLDCQPDSYFFTPKSHAGKDAYDKMIAPDKLFILGSTGVQTSRDDLVIGQTKESVLNKINLFLDKSPAVEKTYKNSTFWNDEDARKAIREHASIEQMISSYCYRPFDDDFIFFDDSVVHRTKKQVMSHLISGDNACLIIGRQGSVVGSMDWNLCFTTNTISDLNVFYRVGGYCYPLYIYEKIGILEEKRANFDLKIYASIKKIVPQVTPESLFDYIYAVLHSPAYRKRYAEFLKSDFPRIPYPQDAGTFDALAKLGGEIRALHLLESKTLDRLVTTYPVGGDHEVIRSRWEDTDKEAGLGKVWINTTQYFDRVPKTAWEFFIGGYRPAQQWLKHRQGRTLTPDDIRHWQKIIVALAETDRLMREIDEIKFLP